MLALCQAGLQGMYMANQIRFNTTDFWQGCENLPSLPQTTVFFHQDGCRPYCTPCYNHRILRPRPAPGTRLDEPYCCCAPVTPTPNLAQRYWHGSAHYSKLQSRTSPTERPLCSECNLLSHEEILRRREKRTKIELKHGMNTNGEKWQKCGRPECTNDLGAGPRWWICHHENGCTKECTSLVHDGWGGRRGNKVKTPVGDEAV